MSCTTCGKATLAQAGAMTGAPSSVGAVLETGHCPVCGGFLTRSGQCLNLQCGKSVGVGSAAVAAHDYVITDADQLGQGGSKEKYQANVAAIQVLKQLEVEGRQATPEEQAILVRYVGWGGLPQVFDPYAKGWDAEYEELKALLTAEEWQSARASTPNAHYTGAEVIKAMWAGLQCDHCVKQAKSAMQGAGVPGSTTLACTSDAGGARGAGKADKSVAVSYCLFCGGFSTTGHCRRCRAACRPVAVALQPFEREYRNTPSDICKYARTATQLLMRNRADGNRADGNRADNNRAFDSCFENGNGAQVVALVVMAAIEDHSRSLWRDIRHQMGERCAKEWVATYCKATTEIRMPEDVIRALGKRE